jgi:hypothetical protein
MVGLLLSKLRRGVAPVSVVLAAAAVVAVTSAAIVHHHSVTANAPVSNEIAPIDPTCTSSSPCIEYDNNGTGPGIRGISVNGNGLAGATKNISTSPSNGREGLIGNDISTSGFYNAGVRGLSTRGYGVAGQSTSGPGVYGTSTSSIGVDGTSTSAYGVDGTSTSSYGVVGKTSGSDSTVAGVQGNNNASTTAVRANGFGGPLFVGNNSSGANVFIVDDAGNLSATTATVSSHGNVPLRAITDGVNDRALYTIDTASGGYGGDMTGGYIGIAGRAPASTGTFPLSLTDLIGNNLFYVDGAGNVFAHGTYHNFTITRTGKMASAYGSQATSPTIEDTGSAQLVNGLAYVALDPAFAQTIDPRVAYHVLLTPDGDTRGLFVASKGPNGFVVREVQGGRSSLTFDYHLYASAFGHAAERMVVVSPSVAAAAMPRSLPIMPRINKPTFTHYPKARKPQI